MAKGKSQVNNVVPSFREIESRIAPQVACITVWLVGKEIPAVVADSLDDILQSTCKKAWRRALSVIYNVVEQIYSDILCRKVMGDVFQKHIAKYFETSNTGDKVSENILSTYAFKASIAAFIQCNTSKSVPLSASQRS